MPTITAAEFTRLSEARRLQIERYRTAYFKRQGSLPTDTDEAINPQWLRIKLGVLDCCVPIGTLTKWAKTFEETAPLSVEINSMMTLKRGTSSIRFYYHKTEHKREFAYMPGNTTPLDAAINLAIENDQIRVDIPDIAAEVAQLKAETTANRKQVAKEKLIAKTRKIEKQAIDALETATKEADEARAILDSMNLNQAIQFAKNCLSARRLLRRTINDLTALPTWLPVTYQHEFFNCETQDKDIETRNTLTDWQEHVTALNAAIEARKAYKPRASWPSYTKWDAANKGMSLAAYKKAYPDLASKVYGPAYDKLKEAEKRASDNLIRFLGNRFEEYLRTQGLPESLASSFDYGIYGLARECFVFSRARLFLKTWEQRKADLESQVFEATKNREIAEE